MRWVDNISISLEYWLVDKVLKKFNWEIVVEAVVFFTTTTLLIGDEEHEPHAPTFVEGVWRLSYVVSLNNDPNYSLYLTEYTYETSICSLHYNSQHAKKNMV